MSAGVDGRQVALHVDHDVDAVLGVERLQRLVDAVGAGGVVGPRHHGAAAGLFHRRRDRLGIGRHHRLADLGGLRAAQHMHDHRLAGDIGQRLAGQPGRGHAGRDQDDGVGHRLGCRERVSRGPRRLYGLPDAEANRYLSAAAAPSAVHPSSPARAPFGSLFSMNSFELNKILGAILGTCLILLALNIGAGAIFAPGRSRPSPATRSR